MTSIELVRDVLKHPDHYLNDLATAHPVGVYAALAAVVFCETGLVVTPFLPGDSLLFAVGALAASAGSHLSLPVVIVLLCLAANCGDMVNYFLGRAAGPRIFFTADPAWTLPPTGTIAAGDPPTPATAKRPFWHLLLSRKHLLEAQAFYDRHGRMTIVMARFVPIVRTFAPFVAGVGRMSFARFVGFSVGGGVLWVTLLSVAGYLFGNIPKVKDHFEVVVLAIVFISLLPVAVQAMRGRRRPAGSAVAPSTP